MQMHKQEQKKRNQQIQAVQIHKQVNFTADAVSLTATEM